MTTDDAVRTVWWQQPRRLLVAAALAVVAVGATALALTSGSETFRTGPELIARLGELGAPCGSFHSLDGTELNGTCVVGGRTYVVVTDPDVAERHAAELSARFGSSDGSAIAVGDGWYVYGDRDYVSRVADLLGAELRP